MAPIWSNGSCETDHDQKWGAGAGRAGEQQVVFLVNPLATGKLRHLRALQAAWLAVVDVRNGPTKLDSAVSGIFPGCQATNSRFA